MAGVVFTLGLVVAFVVVLRIIWLRAEEPPPQNTMPPEDTPPAQSPARMPWGVRRQRHYIDQGLRDLEQWVHLNARRPDAGT